MAVTFFYVLPYLLVAAFMTALTRAVLRRRAVAGGRAFALTMVAATFWCLTTALGLVVSGVEAKRLALNSEYFAILTLPPAWLVFALQYTGRVRRLSTTVIAALLVVPAITLLLLWTPGHRLMIYGEQPDSSGLSLVVQHGLWYRIMGTYHYALLLAGSGVLLISPAHSHRLFRTQSLLLVLACALPFAADVLQTLRLSPTTPHELTPLAFSLSEAIILLGVVRFRMFDLVPAARELVIETMPDAIVVMDTTGRIVDTNPAALRLLSRGGESLIGRQASTLLPDAHKHLLMRPDAEKPPAIIALPDSGQLIELRVCPIWEGSVLSGWLALLQDVTERETLIAQLQEALGEVHTLSGLIPICSSCKRVRDDDGYWRQVESYLSEHSEAEFTHGICPECAARLYPEYQGPGEG